jgi:hypothetical protein
MGRQQRAQRNPHRWAKALAAPRAHDLRGHSARHTAADLVGELASLRPAPATSPATTPEAHCVSWYGEPSSRRPVRAPAYRRRAGPGGRRACRSAAQQIRLRRDGATSARSWRGCRSSSATAGRWRRRCTGQPWNARCGGARPRPPGVPGQVLLSCEPLGQGAADLPGWRPVRKLIRQFAGPVLRSGSDRTSSSHPSLLVASLGRR